MNISTEAIVRGVFATEEWEEPTAMQLAICRIRDGVPLGDELRTHPDVIAGVGGEEAVAALPSERGIKPSEVWVVASARTAKTTIATAGAIADVLSLPLEGLGPGEVPRVSITSVKLDVADVPFRKLRAAFDHPALAPLLLDERESDRTLTVRHPSGRPVEFRIVAGGKAAGGLAARWSFGLLADEAPRQAGREDDAVTNLADCLSVVRERLLPGAQIMAIGSPWAPSGPAYDAVETYFGKPTDDVVCLRMTGPAGNPRYWTPERLAQLEAKDPVAWRINALGEFIDPETGLLSPVAIRNNTRRTSFDLSPTPQTVYCAAVDPGEGRLTACIVGLPPVADRGAPRRYVVALAREWTGEIDDSMREAAIECRRFGITRALTDQFAGAAHAAIAARHGLQLIVAPWRATSTATPTTADRGISRLEAFTNLATLLNNGQIELHPDAQFQRDLLSVKKRASQAGGHTIVLPRVSGRHCDYAPALAAALHATGQLPPLLSEAQQFELAARDYRTNQLLGMYGMRIEHDEFGRRQYFRATR